MPEAFDLLAMQRDFLAVLREPLLGDGRAATSLPPRAGEFSRDFVRVAERHLTASHAPGSSDPLQAVDRLDLYHRQYWYRVLDSLEEDFPALKVLLGDDRFRTLLEDYLEATPSRSATLRHLGSALPDFLASHPHLAGRHADAAVELARLEYALCVAFEAGESETAGAAQLEEGRLALQPHVQLFALGTTVDDFWRDATEGSDATPPVPAADGGVATRPVPAPGGRFVVVFRDGFAPTMEAVDAEAFRLLAALRDGSTLADAIERSGIGDAGDVAEAPEVRLQRWFATWTSRGWLVPAP